MDYRVTRRQIMVGAASLCVPLTACSPEVAASDSLGEFVAWGKANARRLRTFDPSDDEQLDDLEPLREIVGKAPVVGVGESAHFGHEFIGMRERITQFLVKRMGFDAVVLESGLPEGKIVDDYVLGGPPSPTLWDDGITWTFGDAPEIRALVEWMRTFNKRTPERKIRFYGMDVPGAQGSWQGAAEQVFSYLDKVEPPWAARFRSVLVPLLAKFERPGRTFADADALKDAFAKLPLADRALTSAYIVELADRIDTLRMSYLQASSVEEYDWAQLVARNLRWSNALVTNYVDKDGVNPDWNARDAGMASNVEWIRKRCNPGGGVVVLAHNQHVQNNEPSEAAVNTASAGMFLRSNLGDDYSTLGFTFGSGAQFGYHGPVNVPDATPDSIDGALARIGLPLCIVNLRRISRDARRWLEQPRKQRSDQDYHTYDELKSWDGLIYFDKISPSAAHR